MPPLFFVMLLIFSTICYRVEAYCGKLEKISFPGPDDINGNQMYEAIMLNFPQKEIEYRLYDGSTKSTVLSAIQIIPPLNELREYYSLANKKESVCIFGDAIETISAHHYGKVVIFMNSGMKNE